MMVIPTWQVIVRRGGGADSDLFRVPESNLDQFLHVLVFNRREFDVAQEVWPEAEFIGGYASDSASSSGAPLPVSSETEEP